MSVRTAGLEAAEARGAVLEGLERWAQELEPGAAAGNGELLVDCEQGRDTVRFAS